MQCIHCQSETVVKNGTRRLQDGQVVQYYRCRGCHRNFNERTGTPMARLRTPSSVVEFALKNRSEGMGARATGRVYNKSHGTILAVGRAFGRYRRRLVTACARGSRCDLRRR
jgi:transposase-like protein